MSSDDKLMLWLSVIIATTFVCVVLGASYVNTHRRALIMQCSQTRDAAECRELLK